MVMFSIILLTTVFVLSEYIASNPDVENQRKSSIGDFSAPTASEDRFVPIVWGTVKLNGPNVVWYGDLKQKAITTEVGGGIFTSGEDQITGYKYFIGIQMGLCRGGSEGVTFVRVWNGEDIVWDSFPLAPLDGGQEIDIDEPKLYGGTKLGTGGLNGTLTCYGGTETQTANAYLSTQYDQGGVTPAYRGMAYAVWERGYVGTSTSIEPWSFEVRRIPIGLGSTNSAVNSGYDANPAHVAYEYLTDDEWGRGEPAADIDTANFQAAAATLAAEGNGFSFQLETPMQDEQFIEELERQMAGKIYLNQSTGQWQIKLARNDYTVGSLPLIDESSLIEEIDYSRGAWSGTTNDVKVSYSDRQLEYKETFALAQDTANQQIQEKSITGSPSFPGCKDAALANNLAWRELRILTRPLARATLVVTRKFWDTVPLDVLRWTDTQKGFTDLAMRVMTIDLGSMQNNQIKLTLVEDIFAQLSPTFGDPFGTGWVPPEDTLVAVPTNEQVIIDAPRGMLTRDPTLVGGAEPQAKVWCGFRAQGNEAEASIEERNALTTPSGFYGPGGSISATFEIGTLTSDLDANDFDSGVVIAPISPSTQSELRQAFGDVSSSTLGTQLVNLVLVNDEFMLVEDSENSGGNVNMKNVWRGVLDSAPADHSSGDRVYLLGAGGALTDPTFPTTWTVDIRLLPESTTDVLASASGTVVQVSLDDRLKRPYPPAVMKLGTVAFPSTTVDLDAQQGASEDTKGVRTQFYRRDFRTTNEVDSITSEDSLPADFPTNNTTQYKIEVRNDPAGANTLLFTIAYGTATNDEDILRTQILKETAGVIPTTMRFDIYARHTYLPDGVVYESLYPLRHDFAVSSSQLSGLENDGVLVMNAVGTFSAPTTDTYRFTIGTSLLSSGVVEAQINGGGYSTVIATSGTTGTLAGVTSGDTVDYRHTQTGSGTTETILIIEEDTLNVDRVYSILDI